MIYDLRILKYLRISEEDEKDGESNSITYQRELIDKYIADNFSDLKVMSDEIMDDGFSGTSFKRPGITKALNALAAGNYNCMIVKDFSRFGRDHIQVGNYLEHIFPEMGIRFISVNDHYDSKDLIGRTAGIDVVIKNLVHEMYSKDLSQKMRSAKDIMIKEGKYSRPQPFYGYVKDGQYGIKINEEVAGVIRYIFERFVSGVKMADIARELNAKKIPTIAEYNMSKGIKGIWNAKTINFTWDDTKIRKIIYDERYTGKMILGKNRTYPNREHKRIPYIKENWICVENNHEPIISQELYDKAHARIAHTSCPEKVGVNRGKVCIFKCGGCGHTMVINKSKKRKIKCSKVHFHLSDECVDKLIPMDEINEVLQITIKKHFEIMLGNAKLYKEMRSKNKSRSVDEIEDEIAALKRKRFDLYEKYKRGDITKECFLLNKENIANDITALEDEKNAVTIERTDMTSHSSDIVLNYGTIDDISEEFIKYFIREVIVFKDKRLKIIWNFNLNELLKTEEFICATKVREA